MEEHSRGGLTEKNLNVIRQVLTGQVWDGIVQLPRVLMAEARLLGSGAREGGGYCPDRHRDRHPALLRSASAT